MAHFDEMQTSFLGGEISPKARARVDLEKFKSSCATIKNCIVHAHGGVGRRLGTKYVTGVKHHDKVTILHDFNYKGEYNIIFEFGEYYLRAYIDQLQVVTSYIGWVTSTAYPLGYLADAGSGVLVRCIIAHTSGVFVDDLGAGKWEISGGATDLAYEIPTPYTEAQLSDLYFNADDSTLYITHPDHEPRRLDYTPPETITLDTLNYLTYESVPYDGGGAWVVGDTAQLIQGANNDARIEVLSVGATGDILLMKTTVQGEDAYTVNGGACNINAIAPAIGGSAACLCTSDSPPEAWDSNDYPAISWFYEQRLMFANTASFPNRIWGSWSGVYMNFTTGTGLDNQGIDIIVKKADKFVWASSVNVITLGATNGEFLIVAADADEAMTPSNIRPLRATGYGSPESVKISEIDANPVFMQRGKRKVRRLSYDLASNKYAANDISKFSDHMTLSGIIDMAYMNEPDSMVWFLREDGELAGLTYDPEEESYSWHGHIIAGTDAEVISIASINGLVDSEDELWMVVERTVDSSTVKYVEFLTQQMADDATKVDAFYVDSGVTATGSSLSSVTTLDHLEGEEVQILADGSVQAPQTVSSGTITIDPVADEVHAGLYYDTYVDTLPIEGGNPLGVAQGKIRTIYSVIFRLYKTLGMKFGVPDQTLDDVPFGPPVMDEGSPLITGDTDELPFPGGASREGTIRFQQTDPLPMNVLGIIYKASTDV